MAALEASVLNMANTVKELQSRVSALDASLSNGGGGSGLPGDALKGMDGDLVLRSLVWPEGTYGLLMPETGCPSQGFSFVDWRSDGYRQFHTESTSTVNLNQFSPNVHLKQPYQTTNGAQQLVFLYFCVNNEGVNNAEGPTWPSGSYCIHKRNTCPEGFHEGSIFWDQENTLPNNKYSEMIPNGAYGSDTRMDYCCRRDGRPDDAVYLPTAKPFYLYRFDGKCQQVAGMNVVNEFIVFDTENTGGNIDKYTGEYHPDGRLNDIRVELCYYSR
ncbi:unnamed protein product [Lymnaea stagnalis]|uniref:Apextrin C-terminal domain-containing protein n=1 Tax=Lymnaea stagnalis TaxID=6523 RepID=A0AAV2HR44_LYMST